MKNLGPKRKVIGLSDWAENSCNPKARLQYFEVALFPT